MTPLSDQAVLYFRVSTARQGVSGLGLEAQRKAVYEYLNGGNWHPLAEFTEIESGRRKDRPELKAALDLCRKRRATLVIAKLDRLARNVAFVSALLESKVRFVAADMPEADPSFLQMAAVFGEWEARRISERTKAALAAAKARGRPLGWAIPGREQQQHAASVQGAEAKRKAADRRASNVLPIIRSLQATGLTTLASLASALNARGIESARGGQWHPATVSKVMQRVIAANNVIA